MAKFTARVTQALQNAYAVIGGRGPSELETAGPIQPVHDMSSQAGWGRAASQYGTTLGLTGFQLSMTHVTTGVLHGEALGLYAVESAFFKTPVDELWIWILDVSGFTDDATDFEFLQASVFDPDVQGTGDDPGEGGLLKRWAATGSPFEVDGDFPLISTTGPSLKLPYLLTPGAGVQVTSKSDTSGTVTITARFRIWVGPRFTLPPGF